MPFCNPSKIILVYRCTVQFVSRCYLIPLVYLRSILHGFALLFIDRGALLFVDRAALLFVNGATALFVNRCALVLRRRCAFLNNKGMLIKMFYKNSKLKKNMQLDII